MTLQRRRALLATLTAALLIPASLLTTAGSAHAATAPSCPTVQKPVQVGDAGVPLEGAVVDTMGRLLVTDLFNGKVLRFDRPGATPTTIATLPKDEGGGGALALTPDGTVLVGGGANIKVFNGDVIKPGTIWKLSYSSTGSGTLTKLYSGFSAANGMDVAADGTVYATNDFGNYVGRVLPNGTIQSQWTRFPSANGAVLSKDDKYLYVSRTFWNPGVSRIPVNNPTKPESLLDFTFPRTFDAPDGLTLDSQDRPVVPTDVGGQILRIEKPGVTCVLANDLGPSSVIVYGRGTTGFAKGHLYRAGFDGKIFDVPSGFDPAA